jgi:hypothetical protein
MKWLLKSALPHERLAIDRWLCKIDDATSKEIIDAYVDACHVLIETIKSRTNERK